MKINSITQLVAASVLLATSLSLASAQSSSVKIDILIGKIVALNQADRIDETLPIFEELDRAGFEPTESSSYFRIRALDKAARLDETLSRGHQFLERYGRASKYYGQVIAIVSQRTLDKEQATARQRARDLELAAKEQVRREAEALAQREAEARAHCERSAAYVMQVTEKPDVLLQCGGKRLHWTRQDNGYALTSFRSAQDHCEGLGRGWSLPTVEQLWSVTNGGSSKVSCGDWACSVSNLFQLSGQYFWSSDPDQNTQVMFDQCQISSKSISWCLTSLNAPARALCVRRP